MKFLRAFFVNLPLKYHIWNRRGNYRRHGYRGSNLYPGARKCVPEHNHEFTPGFPVDILIRYFLPNHANRRTEPRRTITSFRWRHLHRDSPGIIRDLVQNAQLPISRLTRLFSLPRQCGKPREHTPPSATAALILLLSFSLRQTPESYPPQFF